MSNFAIIEVSNLPSGYDYKKYRALFSDFGEVQKLYIDPEEKFAKVYFDTFENADKAREELNGKPPLNLLISEPKTKDYKFEKKTSTKSNNFPFNNDNSNSELSGNMNRSYRSYDNVEVTPSHQYVDIFGRVVTTLESDDGEMYVSLDELKKSGFELFQGGSLPRRGLDRNFDEKVSSQFELYLRMKAAKFMSRNQLTIPEDQINHVIDREKKDYFEGRHERVVQRDYQKQGLLTITAAGASSPNQSLSPRGGTQYHSRGRPSSTDEDKYATQKQRNRSSHRNDENAQHRNNATRDDSNSNYSNKPKMRRPYTTENSRKEYNSNNDAPLRKPSCKQESNFSEPKPLTRVPLAMNTTQKPRSKRASYEQKEAILNFMEDHRDFALNNFVGADGQRLKKKLWAQLSTTLNACGGALKSTDQWMKFYGDWRNNTRGKARDLKKYKTKTGTAGPAHNLKAPLPLTEQEDKLMGVIGWEAVDGDGATMEVGLAPIIESSAETLNKVQEAVSAAVVTLPAIVTVLHIENDLSAWVQLSSNVNIVEEILLQTVEESAKAEPVKPLVNTVCAALFCKIWFRAVILKTHPLKVQYIDYGNENTEVLTEVRELSDKLASIPGQAIRICFEFGSHPKLEPHTEFFIYPIMQEDDGTYIVRTQKEIPKSALKQTTTKPSSIDSTPPRLQNSVSPSASNQLCAPILVPRVKPSPEPSPVVDNNISQISNTQRKVVTDDVCDNGLFECTDIISDTTFIGAAMPSSYTEELSILEGITEDCKPDPSFKPKLGDLVATKKDSEYVRGTIINNFNGKYTCALIDFGVTLTAEDLRPLPEKYQNIPEFACECTTEADILKNIVTENCSIFLQIKSPSILNLKLENGREYVIKSSRWDPFKTSPFAIKKAVVEETQAIFIERPPSRQLKSNDIVRIVAEQDGYLMVRTRECNSLLNEVNQELRTYKGESFKKPPEVGYLAVCPYDDDNLYRVIIMSINGANAMIDYIDYGNYHTVPLKELKTISEKLVKINSTLIKISLKGFIGTQFSPKVLGFLADCSEKKEKFIAAASDGEAVYELLTGDKIGLSEQLMAVDKPQAPPTPKQNEGPTPTIKKSNDSSPAPTISKISNEPSPAPSTSRSHAPPPAPIQNSSFIHWEDLPVFKFEDGINKALCMYTGNLVEGCVTFCLAIEEVTKTITSLPDKIQEEVDKYSEPYHPQQFEVCLAKYEGDWCRAAVIQVNSNTYGVYYIDYGNSQTVSANDIRRMSKELANVKTAALLCQLSGVIKDNEENVKEPLLSRLEADIGVFTMYEINVLEQNEGSYVITIPSLYKVWKKDGLL